MADFSTLTWNTMQPRSKTGHKFCQCVTDGHLCPHSHISSIIRFNW